MKGIKVLGLTIRVGIFMGLSLLAPYMSQQSADHIFATCGGLTDWKDTFSKAKKYFGEGLSII